MRKLLRITEWGGRLIGGRSPSPGGAAPIPPAEPLSVDVRIEADLLAVVRAHIEDFSRGEEAGFLVCSVSEKPAMVNDTT